MTDDFEPVEQQPDIVPPGAVFNDEAEAKRRAEPDEPEGGDTE